MIALWLVVPCYRLCVTDNVGRHVRFWCLCLWWFGPYLCHHFFFFGGSCACRPLVLSLIMSLQVRFSCIMR